MFLMIGSGTIGVNELTMFSVIRIEEKTFTVDFLMWILLLEIQEMHRITLISAMHSKEPWEEKVKIIPKMMQKTLDLHSWSYKQ